MGAPREPRRDAAVSDNVADDGVFETVRDGYDAVYDALAHSAVFNRIWRANAYGGDFPEQFAHIGFLTLDEARLLVELLAIDTGSVLVDVACGTVPIRPRQASGAGRVVPRASPWRAPGPDLLRG